MGKRFVSIWFRGLITDWLIHRRPAFRGASFVFASPDHGRMLITAVSRPAEVEGIHPGMAVADARAVVNGLTVFDDRPGRTEKLLQALAEWSIRFTPIAAIDAPDGLLLDISGCAGLWGGENAYITDIIMRLQKNGYLVRAGIADTPGTAWALARYGLPHKGIAAPGEQAAALASLPAAALRLSPLIVERLQKLGLHRIDSFMQMPPAVLRRRFGQELLTRLYQALGHEPEWLKPVIPEIPYQERLPCLEPILTATGIAIALKQLLERLCTRLRQEAKGIRKASFKGYRMDGKTEQVDIGTHTASHHTDHLFKLFEPRLAGIEPALGIELFVLEAPLVQDAPPWQQQIWAGGGLNDTGLAELLDRLSNRLGPHAIHRYLPAAHYWPERSMQLATTLHQKPVIPWQSVRPRPTRLLSSPELIEVTAPVPDYPPMLFRYKNQLHTIKKADGPERIEREWWIEEGPHRDYYCVEDENGARYWIFRSGHYTPDKQHQWFLHGFFA